MDSTSAGNNFKFLTGKWRSRYNFDIDMQRTEVWSILKRSILIHSLIVNYPVPTIFIEDKGKDGMTEKGKSNKDSELCVIDGKQRLTSILRFANNEFALHDDTPPVGDIEIAGLFYKELPDEIKNELENRYLPVCYLWNMTDSDREEVFLRLNGGQALSSFELTRALAVGAGNLLGFVREITSQPLFQKVAITAGQKKTFRDQEAIFQTISLILNRNEGFSAVEIRKLVNDLKKSPLPEKVKDRIKQITEYLNDSIEKKQKYLKKVNIPVIYYIAGLAIDSNIGSEKFGKFLDSFFEETPEEYKVLCQRGTSKKDNVMKRLEIMRKSFENGKKSR